MQSVRTGILAGLVCCLSFAATLSALPVFAQDEAMQGVAETVQNEEGALDPNRYMGLEETYQIMLQIKQPEIDPRAIKTLFFTKWQHALLLEAKNLFRTRRPEEREIASTASTNMMSTQPRVRGIRELSLSGILYKSGDEWIVWLNGQRVTPDAIPREVIDMKVRNDYIELKWFDSFTNLIYPIRLRPHQRFNLDSRIFLPGTAPL